MVERITAAAERESHNTDSTSRNRTHQNDGADTSHEEAA